MNTFTVDVSLNILEVRVPMGLSYYISDEKESSDCPATASEWGWDTSNVKVETLNYCHLGSNTERKDISFDFNRLSNRNKLKIINALDYALIKDHKESFGY